MRGIKETKEEIQLASNRLRGLVLSGGESRRMGRDKGLIAQDSTLWVNRAGKLLQSVELQVSVMIRQVQRTAYEKVVLPEFELLTDLNIPVGGPLKGLLSFHQLYPEDDVLVLPCDMPNLTPGLLVELIGFYHRKPDYEAWMFKNQKFMQPFPGIYSARLLNHTLDKIQKKVLFRHGLKYLLSTSKTAFISVDKEAAFRNFNSPSDQ